ncbi:MAG TPA: hypothetical protein VJH55_04000 [Candidatus Paceibacterota bacterium]
MPTVAYAAREIPAVSTFIGSLANHILNPLIQLMFAVALIYFLWGVFEYFVLTNDSGKRAEGAQHILWGLVGMFIMISVYSLIYFVTGTIGVPQSDLPPGLR